MKFLFMHLLVSASVLITGANLMAQAVADEETVPEPSPPKAEAVQEDETHKITSLPSPLSSIRTNILDLQGSGYFAIDAVEFRTRGNGDEAIVWTVRVKKAVTFRHVESMLREFRDVRFYSTPEKRKFLVLATLAHYSDRISLGSSSDRLLRQDDVFDFWIALPKTDFQKLISFRADTLLLRRWRY